MKGHLYAFYNRSLSIDTNWEIFMRLELKQAKLVFRYISINLVQLF